ncbi:MAG: gliding motility-associated C-terminal domain-containing protein [Owenweeksia sp.]|nr:gliding motility-associated C-terminal domain-containing protein [Owenweeksia sp.]
MSRIANQYFWNLNDTQSATGRTPELRATRRGLQKVKVRIIDSLCSSEYEQELSIFIEELLRPTFIPNVFTPNGDGINDAFKISGEQCQGQTYLRIFNRWGQLVFGTDQPFLEFWDGRVDGKIAPRVFILILLKMVMKYNKITNAYSLTKAGFFDPTYDFHIYSPFTKKI